MLPFDGKKFYADKDEPPKFCGYDIYGQPIYKKQFYMTKSYRKYLCDKEDEAQRLEVIKLKEKLAYQYATYHEVDEVDYQRFIRLSCELNEVKITL